VKRPKGLILNIVMSSKISHLKIEKFEDLKKVGDLYNQLDDMIMTTDINEDLIEMMQKPLYDILKANGCDWEERDI